MRIRGAVVLLVLASAVSLLASCGESHQGTLYVADRDLFRAQRMDRALLLKVRGGQAPAPEQIRPVRAAYEKILNDVPARRDMSGPDSTLLREIGMVRAQASRGVIRLARALGDSTQVIASLIQARSDYPWSTELSLGFGLDLIGAYRALGRSEEAVQVCQEIASQIPARDGNGKAVVPVMDAPIWAADMLLESGKRDEAMAELDRAQIFFREIIDENADDPAATLAMVQLAFIATRRGETDRAVAQLERAQRSRGSGEMQARILYILGTVHQESRQDYQQAVSAFGELAERFPDDPLAPEALIREATALAQMNRRSEALQILDGIERKYPRDRVNGAKARLLSARLLTEMNRWSDAVSKYRSLMADFPYTDQAIGAPIEMADRYRQVGEKGAMTSTLTQGINDYERIREERKGTREAILASDTEVLALIRLEEWERAADRLLESTGEFPAEGRNPVRMIQAATIIKEHLKDRGRAADILDRVAAQYPKSPFADRARDEAARLRNPAGGS